VRRIARRAGRGAEACDARRNFLLGPARRDAFLSDTGGGVLARAGARRRVTHRDCGCFRARWARGHAWPGGCDGEGSKQAQRTSKATESAMMLAFVMAVVGVAVLGTLNLVAAR
jgi:hypothetical protein